MAELFPHVERLSLLDRLGEAFTFDPDGCWRWKRSRISTGYGQIYAAERPQLAHRVMYELLVGPIPEGLQLDHLCRVRECVNPAHLEPVTRHENILRGDSLSARRARQTTCLRGHPLAPFVPGRSRSCLACQRERRRGTI